MFDATLSTDGLKSLIINNLNHTPHQILNALITNLFINKVSAECKL